MMSPFQRRFVLLLALASSHLLATSSQADEKYSLKESDENRTYIVSSGMAVNGNLQTPTGGGKSFNLKLQVQGQFQYYERRLPPSGRDAEALRSMREYLLAKANIKVNDKASLSQLPSQKRFIIAHGQRDGAVFYSRNELLNSDQIELLQTPGDSLPVTRLLPKTEVNVGDTWTPESWVTQMLTSVEATLKSEMQCKLESVTDNDAKVSFSGSIEGAVLGAPTKINLTGSLTFDRARNFIREVELTQTEKRDVGAVSPGIEVTAKMRSRRSITSKRSSLSDAVLEGVPLDLPAQATLLSFDSPWNVRLTYARDWHVFHQTREVAVLRLLHQGGLLSQCNISQVPSVAPGQHTPEAQFQADVRAALGTRLERIKAAEQIKTDDGRYLYRVTATGKSNDIPMHWFYYICASPQGRQLALSFAVETEQLKQFSNRDLDFVQRIRFSPPRVSSQDK
ncbi:MAG: hypothetical protein CMJ78_02280 [Planctomycetaceae bacterium]|nr:hypothetical protein [Planctomycetaceae bacterium]